MPLTRYLDTCIYSPESISVDLSPCETVGSSLVCILTD